MELANIHFNFNFKKITLHENEFTKIKQTRFLKHHKTSNFESSI